MAKISDDDLRKMAQTGLSSEGIGAALGLSGRTIRRRLAEIRERDAAQQAPTKPRSLRDEVVTALRREMDQGSVPAMRELLAELNRAETEAEWDDRVSATNRAMARALSLRLGAWVRPHLETDERLRELWRKCGGTLVNEQDREALISHLLEIGAEQCLAI